MVIPYRYGMQTLWIYRDRDWIRRPRGRPNRNIKKTLHLIASLTSLSVLAVKSQGLGASKVSGRKRWRVAPPLLIEGDGVGWAESRAA